MSNRVKYLSVIVFNSDGSIHAALQQGYTKNEADHLARRVSRDIDEGKTVQLQSTLKIIHTISKSDGKLHFDTVDTTDFTPMTRAHSPEFQEERLIEFCKDIVLFNC